MGFSIGMVILKRDIFLRRMPIKCNRLGKSDNINGKHGLDNKKSNIFSVNLHSLSVYSFMNILIVVSCSASYALCLHFLICVGGTSLESERHIFWKSISKNSVEIFLFLKTIRITLMMKTFHLHAPFRCGFQQTCFEYVVKCLLCLKMKWAGFNAFSCQFCHVWSFTFTRKNLKTFASFTGAAQRFTAELSKDCRIIK